jgi:hypothetical protein
MAMEVQRVLFLILGRKGSTRMKKIWLISFPEKIQAASWLRIPNCFSEAREKDPSVMGPSHECR